MIEQMLVLSTAHITDDTCNQFIPSWPGPAFDKAGYGWFVYVVEDGLNDIPDDLRSCLHMARINNCFWVMFDSDAPVIEGLPVYEW